MSALPAWDPDEHDEAIRRLREDARRQRQGPQPANKRAPGGPARGYATETELQRRRSAQNAMQRRARRERDN